MSNGLSVGFPAPRGFETIITLLGVKRGGCGSLVFMITSSLAALSNRGLKIRYEDGLTHVSFVVAQIPHVEAFTCRNCGGGDRGRVAIYRPFGEVSLSLNRTVTCMVLKANDRRTSCPCHDEFRGPRSDYVRQFLVNAVTPKCLGGPPIDLDRLHTLPCLRELEEQSLPSASLRIFMIFCDYIQGVWAKNSVEDIRLNKNDGEECEESADATDNIPVNPDIYVARDGIE
ncbi:uncharacterized protein TNCV_4018091 [Trichonephila clavipes]|nr:uncharacterized protein TNCV_4018091 [Trichonephila clavipes]